MTKDLGSGVSGYLDPEGRNWETTVYQASKPVLDKELNLTQDTEQDHERRLRSRTFPSGWVSDDFLNTSSATSAIFTASTTANELEIPQDRLAYVNGWQIKVASTNATATNVLDLGAGPAGAGTLRTDLVILEVWRRLLDAASVSTDGKSPAGRIWLNGNVKIDAADDVALNFADDIEDGAVGSETTKRVQIQYRLRVIPAIDLFANPYGIDDPTVVANTVPAAPAAPDGAATAFTYTNQSSAGDAGLWRAGDGVPANGIGAVDGYMYAIPLMAVVRRNTDAFDKNSNHNGGVADPGPSDRPDGFFHDIFVDRDIIDLRFGVSPAGWNYQNILDTNFNLLMDNAVRTEIRRTLIGGGYDGNTYFTADEIGITNANGGDGVTTGDTPGAVFIGQFDAARRRYSDRTILETVTVRFTSAAWMNNDVVTIDPTALELYPYASFNWAAYAPSDISFVEIIRADFIGNGAAKVRQTLSSDAVTSGLGGVPQGSATIDIGTVPASVTDEDLYVQLVISYPRGVGLTKTPTSDFGSASLEINNPGNLPAAAPHLFDVVENFTFDFPHREVEITYKTLDQTISFSANSDVDDDIILFNERVLSISAITINAGAYAGAITISNDGYSAQLDPGSLMAGDEATVTFKAIRPFPQNDEQVTVYYDARSPQPIRDAHLPASITLTPRYISPYLYSLVVGSGSEDEAFPWPFQYVQSPGVYPTSGGSFSGDHELDGGGTVTMETFSADTGMLKLPALIGYVPNPEAMTFGRTGGDIDAELRSFFKEFTPSTYVPSAFAQPFNDPKRHKVLLPMLAELSVDGTLGRRGQLVMAIVSMWEPFNSANRIATDTSLASNFVSMSLYRVKGNLLNHRAS